MCHASSSSAQRHGGDATSLTWSIASLRQVLCASRFAFLTIHKDLYVSTANPLIAQCTLSHFCIVATSHLHNCLTRGPPIRFWQQLRCLRAIDNAVRNIMLGKECQHILDGHAKRQPTKPQSSNMCRSSLLTF